MRQPEFWNRVDFASRLIATLLSPLGWVYGATVAYRAHHSRPMRTRAKVVCVGNLTAGGTGKTPIALEIARLLIVRGVRTAFLTRGYGGRTRGPVFVSASDHVAEVGDEPLLLSAVAPVVVSRDRAAGARLADEHGFDVIVMDDGHQNFSLAKDLSLIVIDAAMGFGNGRMIPAGPLREPVDQGIGRADAIILNGAGSPFASTLLPTIRVNLVPTKLGAWENKRVLAFAGIGRPERFFATLAQLGAVVVGSRRFGDHHRYSRSEIEHLKSEARSQNAMLVTTEKDFVRMTAEERDGIEQLRVLAEFADRALLDRLLDRLMPHDKVQERDGSAVRVEREGSNFT
jgi:tetraacyldisaccharide 4'-kinase